MAADLPAEAAAADAWARDHGCRNINFCCKTPRESFQAGWDAGATAERERIARLAEQHNAWYTHIDGGDPDNYYTRTTRRFADLIRQDKL
jgi:hypothetical protein